MLRIAIAALSCLVASAAAQVCAQTVADEKLELLQRLEPSDFRTLLRLQRLGVDVSDLLRPSAPQTPRAVHGFIRGAVASRVVKNGDPTTEAVRVYLPDVIVFLRNASTRRVVASTRTDLNGAFYFPPQPPGEYEVCQQRDGFVPGCRKPFTLSDKHLYLEPIDISPMRKTGVLFGRVRQADGRIPRNLIEVGNVNAFARVAVRAGGKQVAGAYVNNYGDYMAAGVPLRTFLDVEVGIEKELMPRTVDNQILQPGLAHRLDIRLDNRQPEVEFAVARSMADGSRVRSAAPGDKVQLSVSAKDRNGDALNYRWVVAHGGGELSDPAAASPVWSLGLGEGPQSVMAIVYDGRGGYDKTVLTITTKGSLTFGGRVVSRFGGGVEDVEIEVNGVTTKTGPDGHFRLGVPDADRFVFNAFKPGFGLVSQVYDDPTLTGLWRMSPATTRTLDPKQAIEVTDTLNRERCRGPLSSEIDWRKFGMRGVPHVSDSFGRLVPFQARQSGRARQSGNLGGQQARQFGDRSRPQAHQFTDLARQHAQQAGDRGRSKAPAPTGYGKRPEHQVFTDTVLAHRAKGVPRELAAAIKFARARPACGPGATVRIPADALVRADGGTLSGPVDVSVTTVGITAPDSMPGDWTAAGEIGAGYMESYGAATVDIFDSGGNAVQLRAGATAEIEIPVDPGQLAAGGTLAGEIPLLIYDRHTAIWKQEGTAKLNPAGTAYVGRISHLSEINTDIIKQDQACVRMFTGNITGAFDVEVIAPLGAGSAPAIRTRSVPNTQSYNALYNLPSDTWISIVAIQNGDPIGTYAVLTVPQTGDDPNDPSDNRPTYDYQECVGNDPDANTLVLAPIEGPPDNGVDVFLKGVNYPALALDPAIPSGADQDLIDAIAGVTQEYHDNVDPCGCRDTLDSFKETNSFPGLGLNAVYANSADLGFGRNMNCTVNNLTGDDGDGVFEPQLGEQADTVCYVTNYSATGVADGNRNDDDADYASILNDDPAFATVAMEFSQVEDALQCPVPQAGVNPCASANIPKVGPKIVKFFTYQGDGNADGVNDVQALGGAGNDGDLVLAANLDGVAARPIPQLCMVCHGGQLKAFVDVDLDGDGSLETRLPSFADPLDPNDKTRVDLGSRFLPFDVDSFTIVDALDPARTRAAQEPAFRDLNQIIVRGSDPGQAALDLIDAFYAADPDVFDPQAVVEGWLNLAGDAGLPEDPSVSGPYVEVVGQVCRGCHVAQVDTTINFESAANFIAKTTVDDFVCGALTMPHARVAYEKFWLSLNPHKPALLNAFGATHMAGSYTTFCQNKPLALPTGPLTYEDIETVISGNGCVSCHDAADTFSTQLNLESGNPAGHSGYDDLVDVLSTYDPAMKRVSIDPPPAGQTKAENSRLFLSVDTDVCNSAQQPPCMPLGDSLNQVEQDVIEDWIEQGAPLN